MTVIKDIVDLTVQLRDKVKDRQLAAEITRIQTLISALQSEHFTIIEKNTQLVSENSQLKTENSDLKKKFYAYESTMARVEKQISNSGQESHNILLESIEEKILLLLHNHTKLTLEQVAHNIETSQPIVQMHLKKLFDGGMVITLPANRKWYWQIKENGTRYLRNHNLITQQGVSVDG